MIRFLLILTFSLGITQLAGAQMNGFVAREGNHFVLDGLPYFYAGCNNYYQMVYAADPGLRHHVNEVQDEAVTMGLTVLRTWAFNDGADEWNALQTSPGTYQEYVFQGLDYVVHRANQIGLRLILPLVNYWSDYGGMDQYVEWSPSATTRDDFYIDASCRTWYRDHATTVLNRTNTFNGRVYREDPAIFAWELANEPRCPSDPTGAVLTAWIEEMSQHIKSIDPLHMVTTGSEGFYGPAGPAHNPRGWMDDVGVDFIPQHQVMTIDFATAHVWPDHWGTDYGESMQWVTDHIDDAEELLGKPVVFEEFGKHRPLVIRNEFFQGWYDEIYAHASAGLAVGGSNLWILYHDDYADYDGFGVYSPADSSTVQIITAEAQRIAALVPSSVDPPGLELGSTRVSCLPNPFRQITAIHFQLDRPGWVCVDILGISGRRVRSLATRWRSTGWHEVPWDGRDANGRRVRPGIYLYRIAAEGNAQSGRCALIR